MAVLAYLLPPISGLLAYLKGGTDAVRFHGLQSVLLGVLWPALLFGCSEVSPTATRVAAAVGAGSWIMLAVVAGAGGRPVIASVANRIERAVGRSVRGEP